MGGVIGKMAPHEVVEVDREEPKVSQVTYVIEEIIEYEVIYVQKNPSNENDADQLVGTVNLGGKHDIFPIKQRVMKNKSDQTSEFGKLKAPSHVEKQNISKKGKVYENNIVLDLPAYEYCAN